MENLSDKDKKLLLKKDLSARLSYRVRVCLYEKETCILTGIDGNEVYLDIDTDSFRIESIKPYLRPMSSMTTDEEYEYHQIREKDSEEALTIMDCGDHLQQLLFPITSWIKTIDWLNKKMFDYRGLISMNLALEAPEDMYN